MALKTKEERKKDVQEIMNGIEIMSITPKEKIQSNSDWQQRLLEDTEKELLSAFEGMEIKAGSIGIKTLSSEEFKHVSNSRRGQEFFCLTDTGAKATKNLCQVKVNGQVYNLKYRLTLNLEKA